MLEDVGRSSIVDLALSRKAMGGSALAKTFGEIGNTCPGVHNTQFEMTLAGRCGMEVLLDDIYPSSATKDIIETLLNDELGVVF